MPLPNPATSETAPAAAGSAARERESSTPVAEVTSTAVAPVGMAAHLRQIWAELHQQWDYQQLRDGLKRNRDLLLPTVFVLVNAVAFLIIRPGVSDLWAARARANAAGHGVWSYWFAWFSGGSTPASYSILSPYLTHLITPELALALAAVVSVILTVVLVRGTYHPRAAAAVAAVGICVNMWQGRVPFVISMAFAIGSLIAIRGRRVVIATVLAVFSLVFSPVSAAFLGLALVALVVVKQVDRHTFALPAVALIVGAGLIGLIYGAPGPEPITFGMMCGMIGALVACLLPRPSKSMRVVLVLAIVVTIVIFLIPNGMGSNFSRFVWYCIPVGVVARTQGRNLLLALVVIPIVIVGGVGMVSDLRQATLPSSSVNYYTALKTELTAITNTPGNLDLANYRVEVVDDGTHTGDYALLNNVQLARGWETQSDQLLNKPVHETGDDMLVSSIYQSWLARNAVGYVALNRNPPKVTPEVSLVSSGPDFLRQVWQNPDWTLYQVAHAQPIADAPAKIVGFTQNSLNIDVACVCTIVVRAYWNSTLAARNIDPNRPNAVVAEHLPSVPNVANVKNWTQLTTTVPGQYVLSG